MALSQEQLMKMYGYGNIGSGLGQLFFGGQSDPSKAANEYLNRIGGEAGQYHNPYMQAGQGALSSLHDQYSSLLGGPGGKLNEIGKDYQQSPGFKFALDQALSAGNRSAAAGGMAGSPMAQQQNMATATGMANQDYNNWMQNALGLYGQGLSGQQGMAQMGQQSSGSMSDLVAQQLAQQGAYAYQGQSAKNQSNPWGNILGGLSSLAGIFF